MRLIIFLSFMLFASICKSQANFNGAYNVNAMTEQFTKLYKLDASQSTQYKALVSNKTAKLKQLNSKVLTKEELGQLREVNAKFEMDLLAILNEKQKEAYLGLHGNRLNASGIDVQSLKNKPSSVKVDNR